MAAINVNPFVMKDVLLTVGTDSYEAHVSEVTFTPTAASQNWQGLSPEATFTDIATATWQVTLTYAQDWATANALSVYLFNNEGLTKAMVFEPVAGGAGFTANVVITPGAIGGTVNAFATATVTLGVSGRPVLVP